MKDKDIILILAWIIFLLMAITLTTAILATNNRYKHKCSPDTVYIEVYKQKTDWELLQIALIWQESKGNPKARNGDAVGILQITPIYVAEANRISKNDTFVLSDRESASESLKMFNIVQSFHNPEKDIKKAIQLHNPKSGNKYYNSVMNYFKILKYNQK